MLDLIKNLLLFLSVLPFILLCIFMKNDSKIYKEEPKKKIIYDTCWQTFFVVSASVFFLFVFIRMGRDDALTVVVGQSIAYHIIYFTILIVSLILFNCFSTSSAKLQNRVFIFIKSINEFLKQHFVFNLLVILICVFLHQINDLFLSIIGAYIFYIFTEINNNYKKEIATAEHASRRDVGFQIFMNVAFICFFAFDIEPILHAIIFKSSLPSINKFNSYHLSLITFIVSIILNYYKKDICITISNIKCKLKKRHK